MLAIAIGGIAAGCGGDDAREQAAPPERQAPAEQAGRLVFAEDADLFAMEADGSGRRRLTSGDDIETWPTWSPDGRRLAFVRSDGSIYVMNADGTGIRRVTEPEA